MNSQRAKEIVSSPAMIDVTYNGSKVYIEKVDEAANFCTVHYIDKPGQKMDVQASSLKEQG